MIRKILQADSPSLRTVSKKVAKIDKKIEEIFKDLKDTLEIQNDPEGVGLAAPQIGKNLRIFLISYSGKNIIVVNPEIVSSAVPKEEKSTGKPYSLEGCLSLPHYYGPIKRSSRVKIKYISEKGEQVEEEFKGFFAQIVQHEIDHLNGVLFVDRLLEQKKPLYKLVGKEWEEVEI